MSRLPIVLLLIFLGLGDVEAATQVPFELENGLLWVHVESPDKGRSLNFVLDSGASASVLNLSTVMELGLKKGRKVKVEGIGGKRSGFWPVQLKTRISGIPLSENMLGLDLQLFAPKPGRTLDGLLGYDFFLKHVVQIDFASKRLVIDPSESIRGEPSPLRLRTCGFLTPIRIEGKMKWVRVDTGCSSNLEIVSKPVDPNDCLKGSVIGLSEMPVLTGNSSLTLGLHSFSEISVGFHEKEIFPGEGGLLGLGVLKRFGSVTFDLSRKRMFFTNFPENL